MDLRQASYVVAVVDEGSFTAAAASIPVSQPALSQAIGALERELGTELFHRLGRTVALTPAGEAFWSRPAACSGRVARAAVAEVAGLTAGRLDLWPSPPWWWSRWWTWWAGSAEPTRASGAHHRARRRRRRGGLVRTASASSASATTHGRPGLEVDPLGRQAMLAVLPGTEVPGALAGARLAAFPLITTPRGTSTRRPPRPTGAASNPSAWSPSTARPSSRWCWPAPAAPEPWRAPPRGRGGGAVARPSRRWCSCAAPPLSPAAEAFRTGGRPGDRRTSRDRRRSAGGPGSHGLFGIAARGSARPCGRAEAPPLDNQAGAATPDSTPSPSSRGTLTA